MHRRHPQGLSDASSPILRRRLLVAAGTAAALAGCGFQPLYGEVSEGGRVVADDLAAVRVAVVADRPGQQLRNLLLERLNPGGRPAEPTHRLTVDLDESEGSLATVDDGTVTRARLVVTAKARLIELASSEVVLERRHRATASYNIQDDLFGSEVSVDSARERSLRDISEQIRRELALYFQTRAEDVG